LQTRDHIFTYLPLGFFISAIVFYVLNLIFPILDMDQIDPTDLYGTFTEMEARRAGVAPLDERQIQGVMSGQRSSEQVVIYGEKGV
jgi:NCS1 family nucleobase:cation symporter-1